MVVGKVRAKQAMLTENACSRRASAPGLRNAYFNLSQHDDLPASTYESLLKLGMKIAIRCSNHAIAVG